jgi:hypothetical protein
MSVMRHWVAETDAHRRNGAVEVAFTEAEAAEYRDAGWTVWGPFENEREGIVSLRQQLAEAAAALAVIRGALDDLEHAPFRAQALADLPDIIRAAVEGL